MLYLLSFSTGQLTRHEYFLNWQVENRANKLNCFEVLYLVIITKNKWQFFGIWIISVYFDVDLHEQLTQNEIHNPDR